MKTKLRLTLLAAASFLVGIGLGIGIVTIGTGSSAPHKKHPGTGSAAQVAQVENGKTAQGNRPKSKPEQEWPASPREAVAEAVANFKGKELIRQLSKAGNDYAKMGFDSLSEFCFALPPGDIGRLALSSSMRQVEGYEPELVAFLKREEARLSPSWVRSGLIHLTSHWSKNDPVGALSYLTETPVLDHGEKEDLIKRIFDGTHDSRWSKNGLDQDVIAFVDGLGDGALRSSLKLSKGYVSAHVRTRGVAGALAGLTLSEAEDHTHLTKTLGDVITHRADPGATVEAIQASDYPGKDVLLVRCYKAWIERDVNSGLENLGAVKEARIRDRIINASWRTIWKYDRAAAKQWVDAIEDEALRSSLQETLREANATE